MVPAVPGGPFLVFQRYVLDGTVTASPPSSVLAPVPPEVRGLAWNGRPRVAVPLGFASETGEGGGCITVLVSAAAGC